MIKTDSEFFGPVQGMLQDLLVRESLRDERVAALRREVKELRDSVNSLLVDPDHVPSERRRGRDGDESAETKYAAFGSDDEDGESDETASLVTPSVTVRHTRESATSLGQQMSLKTLAQSNSAGSLRQVSNLLQVPPATGRSVGEQQGLHHSSSAPTLPGFRFSRERSLRYYNVEGVSSREIEVSRDIDHTPSVGFWGGAEAAETRDHTAWGGEEWHPPPTLYAYCVFRVSNSDRLPLREAWYLVLMLTCQVTLVYSFSVSESLNAFNRHLATYKHLDSEDFTCKYWPMVIHDRPLMFIASVACTTVVVLGYMRIKDRDMMMTFHPEPRTVWAKYLINYAWFIQAIWLPCMFCGVTANLLWLSESLMMNSVSLSYLLEMDSYMYSAFVSDTKKEQYREEAMTMNRHADMAQIHGAEWKLYAVGLLQCAFISFALHFLNWFQVGEEAYAFGLWCSSGLYVLVYGLRASQIRVLRPSSDEDTTSVTERTNLTFVRASCLGFSHYVAMTLAWAPMTSYPPWLFTYCKFPHYD